MNLQLIKSTIISALKKNLKPGLILQTFAGLIVAVYFFVPAAKPVFDALADLKQQYGLYYSALSTSLFGGLIPFLYLLLTKHYQQYKNTLAIAAIYLIFWAYRGIEVDCLYRLQSFLFGDQLNFTTLFKKVLVDQFIYSAFWTAPLLSLLYTWINHDLDWSKTRKALDKQFFTLTLPANIVSNWLVWIPAVSFIYAMPPNLQLPLANLVLCFWVLMLTVLNKK